MNKRVVITGMGVVSSVGIGIGDFWKAIKLGKSGTGKITLFDLDGVNTALAAEVDENLINYSNFLQVKKRLKLMNRITRFAQVAAWLAIEDSGIEIDSIEPTKKGIFAGNFINFDMHKEFFKAIARSGKKDSRCELDMNLFVKNSLSILNPMYLLQYIPNGISSHLAISFNCQGPNYTFSSPSTAGAQAIGEAVKYMKNSDIDVMIAGAADSCINPMLFCMYNAMGYLSAHIQDPESACRPFDATRDGTVLGEGAGMLVLEELSHALNRGARIYGEVKGYGNRVNTAHLLGCDFERTAVLEAMKEALLHAGSKISDIDYINANANGTITCDRIETKAVKELFKEKAYDILISSTKSMIGETNSVSGVIGAIVCLLAIKGKVVPPTINYRYPDPECDLDYVPNKAIDSEINTAMCNSFGIDNHSVSLVLEGYRED